MKVLVTGCAGFIGHHLCETLLQSKNTVIGIDSLTDYYDPAIKRRNIQNLFNNSDFQFIEKDIAGSDLSEYFHDCSAIVHLAAQPGVRSSWGKEFKTYVQNNIVVTQLMLEATRQYCPSARFIYASSSSVYGQTTGTVDENYPVKPFSPYGVTKLAGENLCNVYNSNMGLSIASLRFFTVYGPGQRPDMAFHKLIRAALENKSFPMYGDGSQERDFTYVEDIVDGISRSINKSDAYGVFNLGGGEVISLSKVIELVEQLTGRKIKIDLKPSEKGDVKRTSANLNKANSILGYSPKMKLSDGLLKEIEWMDALLNQS